MVSEVWTAVRKEESDEQENLHIVFEVKDENTGKVREERRYESALPSMMMLGGYPSVMAGVMLIQSLPWRFRKVGDNIYIDEPSVGVKDYHLIIESSQG